jgi:hypothetical protein
MKKILLVLLFSLLFTVSTFAEKSAFAETWCQWSGTEGYNCKSVIRGYVIISGVKVAADADNLLSRGFYPLITTEPTLGENQVKDSLVWGFANDEITLTWTVRDLTTTEIDQNTAAIMSRDIYAIWRVLFWKGVITQQEAATILPQEMIDAYQARDRLENP